ILILQYTILAAIYAFLLVLSEARTVPSLSSGCHHERPNLLSRFSVRPIRETLEETRSGYVTAQHILVSINSHTLHAQYMLQASRARGYAGESSSMSLNNGYR
ncbi:hypothetical protein BT69DRAFT_1281504, partial [Atractiella rhizophila]